ncbi:MAG: hypothetical protein R3F65_33565, partial [bacterium]
MSWHDRWTGQPAAAPPPRVIPGRWMLTEGTATWGDVPLVPGDRLTPLGDETWHLQAADADTHEGTFTTPDGLAPLVGDSLREIAAALGDGFDPDHITAVSPLVPELDRRVRVTALTGQLEAELHHVLDIARAPHLRLRVDAERVPLDRVKRPDRRAPLTLASRADDWEAPTLTGVRPRRLLARLTEDEIDFYENRAAARLIDHLLRWLTERLAEIDALVGLLESMADFSDRLDGIDHRRRYRLTSLWGEGYAQHETLAVARETKRRIATLRRQLQGTLTSRLYRAVPSRAQIGDTLRQTNLLQNDQRYRFVARLWQAWLAERHKPEADPRRRHALAQQRARDVDAFARLVVMRALTDLGVTLRRKGGGYTLRWHDTEAHLTLATDGTLTLDGPHHPSWRLVPLPWAPSARPGRLATIAAELAPSVPPRGVSAARTIGLCVDVDPPAEGLLTHA